MTYDPLGGGPLDYFPCRYGTSRLVFRGPQRQPQGNYVAVLGGTETYGKFIDTPYPELLEQICGSQVINLGQINAGVEVFAHDRTVMELCRDARATVVELTGAQNNTNRYYAVHPRRNDRFLRASTLLKTVYREVDFTEFNFTRHLLTGLRDTSPDKFAMIVTELKESWLARMHRLIETVEGPVILLWLADYKPGKATDDPLGRRGPIFVDAAMIDELRPKVAGVVEVVADAEELSAGYDKMLFSEMDAAAAKEMLGPVVHRRAAQRLAETIKSL